MCGQPSSPCQWGLQLLLGAPVLNALAEDAHAQLHKHPPCTTGTVDICYLPVLPWVRLPFWGQVSQLGQLHCHSPSLPVPRAVPALPRAWGKDFVLS